MSTVSPDLIAVVRTELEQGERLAWAMSPEPAAFARKPRRKGIWDAVAILGGGYAVIGASVTTFRSGNGLWMLVPLLLVLLGVLAYLVTERSEARRQRGVEGTVYVLTTLRALIMHTYPTRSVHPFPIEAIADITLSEQRRNCADLSLNTASGAAGLVFRGVPEPESARDQLLRVVRDPAATDRQIAASERYMIAMRQIANPAR
jgi:hypothetical protein